MENKKYKVIFMGTPDFAVPALESLVNDQRFKVLKVVTQADKKFGRNRSIKAPAVKIAAVKMGLDIIQPNNLLCISSGLLALEPDFIVVVAYGKLLKKETLEIPKIASINVHASLLPKYRGAACIQAALLNGDKQTGISIMKMDTGLDTGNIIHSEEMMIDEVDDAGTLSNKLSCLSGKVLPDILDKYAKGLIHSTPQDESKANYVGLIKKSDGEIDTESAMNKIFAQYKAMNPWPGIFLRINNAPIKILELGSVLQSLDNKKGLISSRGKLYLNLKDGAIEIKRIQVPGKKPISADEFIRGYARYLT